MDLRSPTHEEQGSVDGTAVALGAGAGKGRIQLNKE